MNFPAEADMDSPLRPSEPISTTNHSNFGTKSRPRLRLPSYAARSRGCRLRVISGPFRRWPEMSDLAKSRRSFRSIGMTEIRQKQDIRSHAFLPDLARA